MAWITDMDVINVYPAGPHPTPDIIDHVQGLAEAVIGEHAEPVSRRLKSITVEIVRRFTLANDDDPTIESETLGGWSQTRAHVAGLGLTNAEKRTLKQAVSRVGLWTQPTSRGPVETRGPHDRYGANWVDVDGSDQPLPVDLPGDT